LFKDGTSKFRKEIDNKIMKQMDPEVSIYAGFLSSLNETNKPTRQDSLMQELRAKSKSHFDS